MKIIDFRRKGNEVRFYLGKDDLEDWGGDDWNDIPYEHNAGQVDPEYVVGVCDLAFPFEWAVVEPCNGALNSRWCKDDMKARKVPCIVAIENPDTFYDDDFDGMNAHSEAIRFYFGDELEPTNSIRVWGETSEGKNDNIL